MTTCGTWPFPSTIWFAGTKLRLCGLMTNPLSPRAIAWASPWCLFAWFGLVSVVAVVLFGLKFSYGVTNHVLSV